MKFDSLISRPLTWAILPLACLMMALVHTGAAAETKRIFTVPPMQWDHQMSRDRSVQTQGPTALANLTGGIVFGLSPSEVNDKLRIPTLNVQWGDLPFANEYPDEVRYFWVRLDAVQEPRQDITRCAGANSYLVFLFRRRSLFRISWRLVADDDCPSTQAAAHDIFARYLALDGAVAITTHYRTGRAQVVEITDPNLDYLLPFRWENRQRR